MHVILSEIVFYRNIMQYFAFKVELFYFKLGFWRLSIMWTMEKCEPGENVNHGKKKLKSVNQNYVNQKMLVHGKKIRKKFT